MKKILMNLAALMAALMVQFAFAQAAVVERATGTVEVLPGAGAARVLKQGDSVNQGDRVVTRAGSNAVLLFGDGQVVALTANSSLVINAYTFNNAKPEESSMVLSLVQGGMRAITGLIGKAKPANVSYRAGNATIGIRGTDLEIGVAGDDLYALANSGSAEVRLPGTLKSLAPLSGNMMGMNLVAELGADGLPIQLAQAVPGEARIVINELNGLLRSGDNIISGAPSAIDRAIRVANMLMSIRLNAQANELKNLIEQVRQTANQRQQELERQRQQQARDLASISARQDMGATVRNPTYTPLGTIGPAFTTGGSSGGGSLPSCSTISPATTRQPGVNCTN